MSETRVCRKCQQKKPLDQFRLVRSSKRGAYHTAQCLVCEREKNRLRSREKRKSPAFRELEKEKGKSRHKKWGAILTERYRTDANFRAKRIETSKSYVKKLSDQNRQKYLLLRRELGKRTRNNVPFWYARRLLGGTSACPYPVEMIVLKQVHKRIDNFLKEKHEKRN